MSRMIPVDGDEDDVQEYHVRVGSSTSHSLIDDVEDDPFAKSAEEIKQINGFHQNVRKRNDRAIRKQRQASDGSAASKTEEIDQFNGYQLLDVVIPPYNQEYLAKLYVSSAPHYAAVRAKVANVVGLGYDLIESQTTRNKLDKESDAEKLANMRRKLQSLKFTLFDKMDGLNEDDEFIETLQKVYTDYEVTGNGYMEIGRTALGQIAYVGHIPASTMRIRKKRDGFVQIVAEKAVFFRNFGDKVSPNGVTTDDNPNEVIHIKKYSPVHSYYGVPDIISAMQAVAGNEFAARFNLDYFENKAVPRYVIIVRGGKLSAKSQLDILNFFEKGLRGQNHRTLYVPLPSDDQNNKHSFEMKAVEAGTQDASFVNYNKINLESILMAHRVPITKIAISQGESLSAAKDADKTFKEQVCRPEQRVFAAKINKIVSEWTNLLKFKFEELTLTDETEQSKIDQVYLTMKVITPNEVRARWGWPGIDGGDKPVELKAQAANDQVANSSKTRARDTARAANSPDTTGNARNPKGDGRQQA